MVPWTLDDGCGNLMRGKGRTYRIAYDKMTADGRHYFLAYDASGTDAWTQSEAVGELAEMIERDPRSGPLQTVGIVAQRHHGFGLLRFERSEGFIYERRGDRWVRATEAAIDEHLRARGLVPVE